MQDVSIVEQSYSPFVKFELVPLDNVRLVTGARGDIFLFHGTEHVDTSEPFQTREVTKARPNVKANLILGPWLDTEFFANFVTGFQVWWVSAIYIVANIALGMHLYHGLWSMFNSLGLSHDRFNPWKRGFATVFALMVTLANISFPIAVLIGVLR